MDQNPPSQNNPSASTPDKQIAEKLKQANNVLVTVSTNPTVDQLAACIGLTLVLNKLNKHVAAVFSGTVPSTIEFLKPEETLEKTTDSLRDFIISLDRAKADKLRYKVEDKVVRIFITPYRSSISEKDLEFSQGDFNVDVVVALGVHQQQDLDQAITAHGRILHDATVTTISTTTPSTLGSINWQDGQASSLSELVTTLSQDLDDKLLDGQIATALLTGIVAETQRFRNEKTSPRTMSVSSALLAAGANQQLVATKLEPPEPPAPAPVAPKPLPPAPTTQPPAGPAVERPQGLLEVQHEEEKPPADLTTSLEDLDKETTERLLRTKQIHIDEEGRVHWLNQENAPAAAPPAPAPGGGRLVMQQPPSLGGTLTANSRPEPYDPSTDALTLPSVQQPMLDHNVGAGQTTAPPPVQPNETLSELEHDVHSRHVDEVDEKTPLPPPAPSAGVAPNVDDLLKLAESQAVPLRKADEAIGSQIALDEQSLHPDDPLPPTMPTPPAPIISPPAVSEPTPPPNGNPAPPVPPPFPFPPQ